MDALQRELGASLVILPLSLDRGGAELVRNYYNDHDLTTLPIFIDEKMAAGRALRVHGIPPRFSSTARERRSHACSAIATGPIRT